MNRHANIFGFVLGPLAGLLSWGFLNDDFFKFLSIAIPITIQIVSTLFFGWMRVRGYVVKYLAENVVKEFGKNEKLKTMLRKEVVDEVWFRIETINKLAPLEDRKRKTDEGRTEDENEEGFDVRELAAK